MKRVGSRAAVFLVGANGRGVRRLTSYAMGVDARVDWSPNGSLILFSDDFQFVDAYTIRPSGSGLTQLTHSTSGNYSADSWSPDGKHIMLVVGRPGLATGRSLFVMNSDGSGLREIKTGLRVHDDGGSWGTHP